MSVQGLNKKLIKNNILVALVYFGAAALSFVIGWGQFYLLNAWFPFAISAGFVYLMGKKILPGILIASIVSHTFLALYSSSTLSVTFPFATLILLPVFELLLLYFLNHAKDVWSKPSENNQQIRLDFLLFISFILPIPVVLVAVWFLHQLGIASPILTNAFSVYFGFVLTFLLYRSMFEHMSRYQFGMELDGNYKVKGRYPHLGLYSGRERVMRVDVRYGMLDIDIPFAQRLLEADVKTVRIDNFDPKGTVFAAGILEADSRIRPNDLVVFYNDNLFGVGLSHMFGKEMVDMHSGYAIKVRRKGKLTD
ncbi:MAG: PUA domain-containing protein [Perlabentimonas sp.]